MQSRYLYALRAKVFQEQSNSDLIGDADNKALGNQIIETKWPRSNNLPADKITYAWAGYITCSDSSRMDQPALSLFQIHIIGTIFYTVAKETQEYILNNISRLMQSPSSITYEKIKSIIDTSQPSACSVACAFVYEVEDEKKLITYQTQSDNSSAPSSSPFFKFYVINADGVDLEPNPEQLNCAFEKEKIIIAPASCQDAIAVVNFDDKQQVPALNGGCITCMEIPNKEREKEINEIFRKKGVVVGSDSSTADFLSSSSAPLFASPLITRPNKTPSDGDKQELIDAMMRLSEPRKGGSSSDQFHRYYQWVLACKNFEVLASQLKQVFDEFASKEDAEKEQAFFIVNSHLWHTIISPLQDSYRRYENGLKTSSAAGANRNFDFGLSFPGKDFDSNEVGCATYTGPLTTEQNKDTSKKENPKDERNVWEKFRDFILVEDSSMPIHVTRDDLLRVGSPKDLALQSYLDFTNQQDGKASTKLFALSCALLAIAVMSLIIGIGVAATHGAALPFLIPMAVSLPKIIMGMAFTSFTVCGGLGAYGLFANRSYGRAKVLEDLLAETYNLPHKAAVEKNESLSNSGDTRGFVKLPHSQ